jgi:hypothetical protein
MREGAVTATIGRHPVLVRPLFTIPIKMRKGRGN